MMIFKYGDEKTMKVTKLTESVFDFNETENLVNAQPAEVEITAEVGVVREMTASPSESDCAIETATKVMEAYQNANKWLDIIKEVVYTKFSCVFFSSYIHTLAHTMPVRFDKFGDILHTVNMEIPYPPTAYIPTKPTNIDEVFAGIFMILDDIKTSLNEFIKCTDETAHGMACAAETLLNDIESEYPMLFRLQAEWVQCGGDMIKFDKYVNQYVKGKDDLVEGLAKVPEIKDEKATAVVDNVMAKAKEDSEVNDAEFKKSVVTADELDRKKYFSSGEHQPKPEQAEKELDKAIKDIEKELKDEVTPKKIGLDESLFDDINECMDREEINNNIKKTNFRSAVTEEYGEDLRQIISTVAASLKNCGLGELICQLRNDIKNCNCYDDSIQVCDKYTQECNKAKSEVDDDYEDLPDSLPNSLVGDLNAIQESKKGEVPQIGDTIYIVDVDGEPEMAGKKGKVTEIDNYGHIYGTWGDVFLVAGVDDYRILG